MSEDDTGEPQEPKLADKIDENDPHKVEKLAKAGKPEKDPDEGSD